MKRGNGVRYALTASISCLLVIALLIAGCSRAQEESRGSSPQAAPTGSAPTDSAATETAGEAATDKYDPPIEMSTVAFDYGSPMYLPGDDLGNNQWKRYISDNHGIKVNTLWSVAYDQYDQKVNLMIASGKLPDFFAVTPLQFKQLYDAGEIEDLTDSYETHATDDIKQIMADAGEDVLDSARINGKLMAIPWTGVAKEGVPVLWIRKDWFDKLQLSAPATMQDVLNMAKAFAEQDPDGNGANDTYGLALDKDFKLMTGFLNGFHAYKKIWTEDGAGGLQYSSIQPEMKAALAELQKMYQAKQIDPEFGVKDVNKVNETIGSGKIGMIFGDIQTAGFMAQLTPGIEWFPLPVPSIDDQPALMQHPLNIFSYYWVVKKGTAHPEAIYKMIQTWIDLFYKNTSDEIYAQYNSTKDSIGIWMQAPIKIYMPYKNVDIYRHLQPLFESADRENADLSGLTPEERDFYDRIQQYEKGDKSHSGIYGKSGPNSSGKVIAGYIENNHFQPEKFTTNPTATMVQRFPNLLKLEDQMISKIILGGSLDEFDAFVDQWQKLGGADITKEVNEWYKNK